MKRLLFISRSGLCHNLFNEVLSLVAGKIEMVAIEDLSHLGELPGGGKKFSLVVLDQNCLAESQVPDPAEALMNHPALMDSRKILIVPQDRGTDSRLTSKVLFEAIGAKPFLPEELASLIEKWV